MSKKFSVLLSFGGLPRPSRREHLINTAIELFCEHGFHATGIDTILDKAKVSKKTLYTHFRSKEELILAALKHFDGIFRNHFMHEVEKAAPAPRERLLAIYDVAEAWFSGNRFFGCVFINAVGEYSEDGSPIREVSREFKRLMRNYIYELCRQARVADPEQLAKQLALLLEGAIVTAQVFDTPNAAQTAKAAAKVLIEKALDEQG